MSVTVPQMHTSLASVRNSALPEQRSRRLCRRSFHAALFPALFAIPSAAAGASPPPRATASAGAFFSGRRWAAPSPPLLESGAKPGCVGSIRWSTSASDNKLLFFFVASADVGRNFRPPEIATTKRESGSTVPLCQLRSLPRTPRLALLHTLAPACSSHAATASPTAGHTWWPQSHAACLSTLEIPSTGRRFPEEECSNPPAPGTTPGLGVDEDTDPQTGPNLRRFRGKPWRNRTLEGRRSAAQAWVVPLGGLHKS